jgi:hypothetical protein
MNNDILIIIKVLCIAFAVTRFEPLHWILDAINEKTKNNLFCLILSTILTCIKCFSFWTLLFITHSLFLASVGFIIAFIYDKNFSQWEKRIKF